MTIALLSDTKDLLFGELILLIFLNVGLFYFRQLTIALLKVALLKVLIQVCVVL